MRLRMGVLASGEGSNLAAILRACDEGVIDGEVVVVASNNSTAGALAKARARGIPAYHVSGVTHGDDAAVDAALVEIFHRYGVNLVVFAGYMKKRGAAFLRAFPRRVLNIHPALLPGPHGGAGMYGRRVHQAVLAAGDRETGVTIHLVDEEYDHGPVVAQRRVPVLPGDDVDALAARVLAVEHELYPATLAAIARGELDLDALGA